MRRPPAAPDTSKTTSAPAPAVHSSSHAESFAASGARAAKPSFAARALRVGSSSTTADVSTEVPGNRGDEESDRPAAQDDDLVAESTCGPAARRVRRPRRARSAQRHGGRRQAGKRTNVEAGTFHSGCNAPGESMPMKVRFWQMCVLPARQAGQVPSHSSGITVTFSPGDQPALPHRARRSCRSSRGRRPAACAPAVHGPVNDVQVRAAQPYEGDPDADVARRRGDRRRLVEVDRPVARRTRRSTQRASWGLGFVSIWLRRLQRRCLKRHTYDLLRPARAD